MDRSYRRRRFCNGSRELATEQNMEAMAQIDAAIVALETALGWLRTSNVTLQPPATKNAA